MVKDLTISITLQTKNFHSDNWLKTNETNVTQKVYQLINYKTKEA